MAAFQQRRHATTAHQLQRDLSGSAHDSSAEEASTSGDHLAADDGAVLLFGNESNTGSSHSHIQDPAWSLIRPPRSARTTSFTSHATSSSMASESVDDLTSADEVHTGSSVGSPVSLRQASLLPAHAGDGVFFTDAHSAGSLVQSSGDDETDDGFTSEGGGGAAAAPLFPSIYADIRSRNAVDSSDDGAARSTTFSAYSHVQRHSASSGGQAGGSVSDASEWALTEAALSTHRALARQTRRGRTRARDEEEEEDGGSVLLTCGSENEALQTNARQSQRHLAPAQTAAARREEEEEDWAHSPLALSAGFLPPSRRQRRAPPPSSASARDAARPITLLLPPLGSSLRSLSPAGSLSTRSRRSSSSLNSAAAAGTTGFKRRHRHSGTGRSSTSQKRSANGAISVEAGLAGGVSLSGQALVLEQIAREEEDRARRMTAILEQRREEVRLREAEAKILFGHAVRNYMSIDPSTFALMAEADPIPLATIECTPTPSRAHSPSNADLHGTNAFVAQALSEVRFASSAALAQDEEEDSGAETETEHDSDRAQWTSYTATRQAAPPTVAKAKPPTRSHSTSEIASLLRGASPSSSSFGAFSPITTSGLTVRTTTNNLERPLAPPALHRRSSSFSAAAASHALSHEERIMLGSHSSSSSPAMTSPSGSGSAPWGGDVDSFELALNYWKRMWRRFRGSNNTSAVSPTYGAQNGSPTASLRGGAGGGLLSSPQRRTVELLVPEARVGRV
ncbi:hypothetical protein JCM10908_004872 [Rhodotorula pacifica]|uniref:uncharacterized protein n=1 Tax=Rhodotorula pacifica TaxID=1495444 RepID=UPI003179F8B2